MTEKATEYVTKKNDIEKWESRSIAEVPAAPQNQQASFFEAIERLAANPAVDVEKMKQIMEMQEHVLDRNAKQAFNAAMVKAQGRMEVVLKTSKGEHNKFADLEAVLKMSVPIYTDEGFAISFYEGFATEERPLKADHIRMMADIMHTEGHTKTVMADVPLDDKGPQGKKNKSGPHATGSSFSYGRRYLNCMIWNIATGDDDDGNAAGGKINLFEQWEVKCSEVGDNAKSVNEIATWWKQNAPTIKKDLSKPNAAKIYDQVVAFKNKLKTPEREPGSEG